MAQYRTGTVSVTNGSAAVVGTGTLWAAEVEPGDLFIIPDDGVVYEVASVTDNTHLSLSANFAGTTAAAAVYAIARDFTPIQAYPYPVKGDIETAAIVKRALEMIETKTTLISTSTTTLTIGAGSKTLTVETGKMFQPGQFLSIVDQANNANYMSGQVTAYTGSTGSLTVDVAATGGSGTISAWNISLSGVPWATVGVNDIGIPGTQGFGVGICPTPPPGFAELSGTRDKASDNYGNYLYQDGSVMAWVPLFYYRIAHASNPTYATYLLNSIDIQPESAFADVAAANAAGYALHRAFRDGGATKRGVFVDKYGCSNNAGVASSIRYGKPLSTAADHNPINALNGAPALTYAGVIDAAKTRGAKFFCCSMFVRAALALLSVAHGQASTATTYCAWYSATYNFPKGNNNNALGDTNDAEVLYLSDGYSNCGKAGSGAPFAKTTHNGQSCGVADLNGNMYEITLGLTRPGTTSTEAINDALGTTKFHILKESVAMSTLTSGWNTGNDHWGTDAFLDTNFQEINLAHVGAADGWQYFGNGTNQVFSADLSGNNWLMTGMGIYKDANGASASGTNLFGQDGLYEYHASNLCVPSGGYWASGGVAGVCCALLVHYRSDSYASVGFRAACYCD